ncbi:MAG TPA: phage holin family protein [bacterium]|jgi:putative membrane protein|nr:phage holin family protein [bacterium]
MVRFSFNSGATARKGILGWVTQWLVNACGLALVARTVGGVGLRVDSGTQALLTVLGAAAVLGLLNILLKPLLLLVTLPVNLLSLGLFTFVVNGLVLWLVAALVPDFSIAGFWTAVWAALCFSAFTLALNALLGSASLDVRMDRRP